MKRICKYCNQEFEVKDWRQIFCTWEHYKLNSNLEARQKRLKEKICLYCGEKFLSAKQRVCCSDEHYILYRKQYKNIMSKNKAKNDPNFKFERILRG
jgi:hypothetical protein